MKKRQKKKYTNRVYALVSEVRYNCGEKWHIDRYAGSTRVKGDAFRRCWNWMVKNEIFDVAEVLPALRPDEYYSIRLDVYGFKKPQAECIEWGKERQ